MEWRDVLELDARPLDFHPDMETISRRSGASSRALAAVREARALRGRELDDPNGARLVEGLRDDAAIRVVKFGRGDAADVAPVEVARSLDGLEGEIRIGAERLRSARGSSARPISTTSSRRPGPHGPRHPLPVIAAGIRDCPGVPGRMERVDAAAPFAVLVDYAHTPDALERAVRVLRSLAGHRLIVVFGCGGDRDRGKRPRWARRRRESPTSSSLTSDNPRSEDPLKILHEIERGVVEAGLDPLSETAARRKDVSGYLVIPDRRCAIQFAVEIARANDVVLIAGKGHETYQTVGAERFPFDDREEARHALEQVSALNSVDGSAGWPLPEILAATGGELVRWGAGRYRGFSTDSRGSVPEKCSSRSRPALRRPRLRATGARRGRARGRRRKRCAGRGRRGAGSGSATAFARSEISRPPGDAASQCGSSA